MSGAIISGKQKGLLVTTTLSINNIEAIFLYKVCHSHSNKNQIPSLISLPLDSLQFFDLFLEKI